MSGFIKDQIVSAGQGYLQDTAMEYAGNNFQPTKDPYYVTIDDDGNKKRLRLPECCSKAERKAYKKLQNRAWLHDKGLCGCCCWWNSIGWGPLLALIPVIGPALMYWVHKKLIKQAKAHFDLPKDIIAKMHGNIVLDLLISLVPFLGAIFAWMHACSSRNCAMVYNYVAKRALEKEAEKKASQEKKELQHEQELKEKGGLRYHMYEMTHHHNKNKSEKHLQKANVTNKPEAITYVEDLNQNSPILVYPEENEKANYQTQIKQVPEQHRPAPEIPTTRAPPLNTNNRPYQNIPNNPQQKNTHLYSGVPTNLPSAPAKAHYQNERSHKTPYPMD